MGVTADQGAGGTFPVERFGISEGAIVQELGSDTDVEAGLVDALLARAGTELSPEDSDDVVDCVLLWFREEDGDLVDALMDARTRLAGEGAIWVLTPKAGKAGHVEPSDIIDAAPTAGLVQTSTVSVSREWSASKLVVPKGQRSPRHRGD